jgi:molybdate transport system substrate-binding protein
MDPTRIARRLAAVLLALVLATACASPAPTAATPPDASPTARPSKRTLTVFAAASLTESFKELGQQFEATHPGVNVLFNFAGSQQLRAQLEQGAPADVFASANAKEMNGAIESSLVVSGTQQTFAANRLVVIYPKGNPGNLTSLADLGRPGVKLVVADKAVPVGQYTLEMLAKMSEDPAYGADFADRVQKNVVSLEQDVKAVVTKVRLGEADVGVVYSTDAAAAAGDALALDIPDRFNQPASYPIAPLAKAPQPDLARQFVELVLSDAGQQALAARGFVTGTR